MRRARSSPGNTASIFPGAMAATLELLKLRAALIRSGGSSDNERLPELMADLVHRRWQ